MAKKGNLERMSVYDYQLENSFYHKNNHDLIVILSSVAII